MRLVISILPCSGDSLQIHGIDELVSAGLDCSNPSRKYHYLVGDLVNRGWLIWV